MFAFLVFGLFMYSNDDITIIKLSFLIYFVKHLLNGLDEGDNRLVLVLEYSACAIKMSSIASGTSQLLTASFRIFVSKFFVHNCAM